ncbi:MAG: hypothetical protein MRY21_04240 [Simkaniaceae bacterium]|nr:hypothetical protein [Simkaniaceae bacterium]
MLKNKLKSWEVWFVICAMACSFFISFEASILKPVGNSLFLSTYGVKLFPIVWLAVVPANFLIVHLYNRYISHIGPMRFLLASIGVSAVVNISSAFLLDRISWMPFFFYIWKDIYIMLMFQQLWSIIHSTVNLKGAQALYGIFYAMGGLGSVVGCSIPGFLAVKFGSAHLLFAPLLGYTFLALFFRFCLKTRDAHPEREKIPEKAGKSNFGEGVRLIRGNSFLLFILGLVVLMQVVATLLDFQINTLLEQTIPTKDGRTEFLGRLFAVINSVNVFLQLIGSFLLIRVVGVAGAHLAIPAYLGLTVAAALIHPSFAFITFSYASTKSMDHSLFGIVKEMLYIPLKIEEKFKAKAVIDIFVYRTSKALASLIVLALELFFIQYLDALISWGVLLLFTIWFSMVYFTFKRHPLSKQLVVN